MDLNETLQNVCGRPRIINITSIIHCKNLEKLTGIP